MKNIGKLDLKMKKLIVVLVCVIICSCKVIKNKNNGFNLEIIKQDSLAFELCEIYGFDQGIRSGFFDYEDKPQGLHFDWSQINAVDTVNFRKIVAFIREHGFPTEKILGKNNWRHECVKLGAHAVLLHNPHRIVKDKNVRNLLLEEVKNGNLNMDSFIFFLDKYYLVRKDSLGNRMLLYGSQFGKPCLKFRKQSDSVRAEIGLQPLVDSMFIDCNKKL